MRLSGSRKLGNGFSRSSFFFYCSVCHTNATSPTIRGVPATRSTDRKTKHKPHLTLGKGTSLRGLLIGLTRRCSGREAVQHATGTGRQVTAIIWCDPSLLFRLPRSSSLSTPTSAIHSSPCLSSSTQPHTTLPQCLSSLSPLRRAPHHHHHLCCREVGLLPIIIIHSLSHICPVFC